MNLSNSFTLETLTFSETAIRKGLDNTPNADQIENLTVLAQALERVRNILGSSLLIHSGFRSPKVNAAVGGSSTSSHLEGYAADFVCPGFGTPKEVCQALKDGAVPFDQLIQEGGGPNGGGWVHFSVDPRMRGEVLTASFSNGKPSYTQGLT